jgi:hypothetical protein
MSTKNCTNCDPVYIEKCDKDICDIEVPANCVIVNEKYPCIGVNTKPTKLSVFLQKLVDYLCNLVLESSCTVAVSSDDTCCGYLEDKFVSDTLDIETETDENDCQKIRLEYNNCGLDWQNITLNLPFTSVTTIPPAPAVQTAQYAVDNCGKVHFRGSFLIPNGTDTSIDSLFFTLPSGARPLLTRGVLNIRPASNSGDSYTTGFLPDGQVRIRETVTFDSTAYVLLDGFSYEIN